MSDATLPVAPIPIAIKATDAVPQPAPISQAEAAALVQRIRRESRLPRLVTVGAVMGVVCGLIAIWPFLSADQYVVRALVNPKDVAIVGFACSLVLAGLLPMVTFYSL